MDVPQCSLVCAEISLNTLPLDYIERSDFFSRQYIYLLQANCVSYLVHSIWVINICIACLCINVYNVCSRYFWQVTYFDIFIWCVVQTCIFCSDLITTLVVFLASWSKACLHFNPILTIKIQNNSITDLDLAPFFFFFWVCNFHHHDI